MEPEKPQVLLAESTTLAGQVIVGGEGSTTVTVCVQELEFPDGSIAVQVTMFVPTGSSDGASFVMTSSEASLQASVAVASPRGPV